MFRWCLVLALCIAPAWAGSIGPWIGLRTVHLNPQEPVNERNRLIGARFNRWFLAYFQNSFYDPSWAVGYALWQAEPPLFKHRNDWRYSFRLSPGVAYGYREPLALSVGDFTPGLIPSAGLIWQFNERWQLGSDLLYIWTDDGGVLLSGISLNWQW